MMQRWSKWGVSAPPTLFLIIFFLIPTLMMAFASFRYPGEFGGLAAFDWHNWRNDLTLETYQFFFSDWLYIEVFVRSFLVAGFTTLICLLMAYPVAYLIAQSPQHYRNILVLLIILPFASNFLIRVYAWMIILGPMGLLFSNTAVLIGMVYVHLPFMILPLYTNLEKHDPALLNAAQDLGATAWQRFWRITFPLSLPGVYAGMSLVFIPVLGMFAIPELLGGPSDALIGNVIKDQFLAVRDWPFGATLSLILTVTVLGVSALVGRLTRR
jgi:spermidine/putrescine transport system permease protein